MITTVTAPLADFLLARTAEDEEVAQQWPESPVPPGAIDAHGHPIWGARPRVLAECEATRRLVEEHSREWHTPHLPLSPMNRYISKGRTAGLYRAMQYAALPHAAHPDYRQEWAP